MSPRLYLLLYNSKLVYHRFKNFKVFSRRPFLNKDLTKYVNASNNVCIDEQTKSQIFREGE